MLKAMSTKNIKNERNRIAFILLLEISSFLNSKAARNGRKRALFIKKPSLMLTTHDIVIAHICFFKIGNLLLYVTRFVTSANSDKTFVMWFIKKEQLLKHHKNSLYTCSCYICITIYGLHIIYTKQFFQIF